MRKLLTLLVAITGCSPVLFVDHGVPNLRMVEAGLYRGGEPDAAGWKHLRDLGVCSVVQLDYDDERPAGAVPPADFHVTKVAMPPNDADDLFKGPAPGQLEQAADAVEKLVGVGACSVYLHCKWGRDRTGAVTATFLHRHRDWPKDQAYDAAVAEGFHESLRGLVAAWKAVP